MGEISAELKTFKSTVEPSIGDMNSKCSDLSSKIQDVSSYAKTAQSEFSNSYNSQNKQSVLGRFDKLQTIYSKIAASLEGDLKGMLSEAQALIDAVTELENINKEIETQQGIVNSNSGTEDAQVSRRNAAKEIINKKNEEFNTKHEDAKTKLEALKAKDASISFVEEFSPNNSDIDPDNLQYGTFELKKFTASNGLTIEYWLYVPDYGVDDVEGLPAMLYMHGGSTHQNVSAQDAIKYGLSSKIANKEITPSGIVIIPAVTDFTDKGVTALKELTDSVVEETNADTNRISVSGHSYGGITAYKLVNKYPDYWSACVPISGAEKVTDAFRDVKVWSFNGSYETGSSYTSVYSGQRAVDEINNLGGQASITILKTGHAGTNKDTYGGTYLSPDGIDENPLDWIFRQERA